MPPETNRTRLESTVFYLVLAAIVLAPLAFWPSPYFALEAVKTLVIGLLVSVATICATVLALRRKEFVLPPKSMLWIGILTALSVLASSIGSGHFMKSFFGQGFELGAGGFLVTLLLAGLIAFMAVMRRTDRTIVLYAGIFGAYILIWVIQFIRLFAPGFSLGVLGSVTSSLVGGWFSFGILSAIVMLLSFAAIYFLRLTARMKAAYWVLFGASALALILVNAHQVWQVLALVFLGLTIYLTSQRSRPQGATNGAGGLFHRLAWVPLIICVVSAVLAWQGITLAGPIVTKLNAGYSEIVMPWRMTMDIAAGELKEAPLLGAGPNRFTQAFLTHKPAIINTTDAWSVEFNAGFGFIPTFAVTQGLVGFVLWVLFFVFLGILGARSLRALGRDDAPSQVANDAERPYARFVIISSFAAACLIWLSEIVYVPSHAVVFAGFVMTGIWLGTAVAYGRLQPVRISASTLPVRRYRSAQIAGILVLVGGLFLAVTYLKNTAALAYFSGGVESLTTTNDAVAADTSFSKAVALNPLDIYWQARAEAGISRANQLLSAITATSTASTSAAIVASAGTVVNKAIEYTNNAISSDPDNYNNYVSQARVAELATAMRMQNGYDSAVKAYTAAIQRNPGNPSLYLSLGRLAASQQKYDDAIQAIGASLQVKQNYLDAVYLLSQVEAAKGNLADAVTAAQFATQLNPSSPLLFFQLGLLQYNKPDYAGAETSFAQAVKLNPSYANAQYFLGLSQARLTKTADAIKTFEKLAVSNPDNKEIPLILSALRAGKSLFAAGPQQSAARPEKRTSLPIKER